MQGLSIEECTREEIKTADCSLEKYVSYTECCRQKNVFEDFDYFVIQESKTRWLDDYGWL